MRELIDLFIEPILNLLNEVKEALEQASIVAAQGINIEYYLGYIEPLGDNWVMLIQHIFFCALLVGVLVIAKSGWGLYIRIKESIQWW